MPQPVNSLLNKSKRELAEQHTRLVNQVQLLWSATGHRMQDWIGPVEALQQLQREAFDHAEAIKRLTEERDKAVSAKEHTQYWYATRWQTMHDWFRSPEMKGTEAAQKWFNLVANGTANHTDPPTYAQQLNMMRHRAEAAEKELQRLRQEKPADGPPVTSEGFC